MFYVQNINYIQRVFIVLQCNKQIYESCHVKFIFNWAFFRFGHIGSLNIKTKLKILAKQTFSYRWAEKLKTSCFNILQLYGPQKTENGSNHQLVIFCFFINFQRAAKIGPTSKYLLPGLNNL